MSNNIFNRFCESINYQTYSDLEKIFGIGGVGLAGVGGVISSSDQLLNSIITGSATGSFLLFMTLVWSGGKYNTRDINEIKVLYREFIENYVALNKSFDFNDPIEISTMYSYLLYKGYLSKDKTFQFTSSGSVDIGEMDGVNIINGSGVCRHISSMLTDILNVDGIVANRLSVYTKNSVVELTVLYTEEELIQLVRSYITDEEAYKCVIVALKDCISRNGCNIDINFRMVDFKNPIKKLAGNHNIVFATKNDKSYFLDPTQAKVYRMDNGVLTDDEDSIVLIKRAPSVVFNGIGKFNDMCNRLSLNMPSDSREEWDKIIQDTLKVCRDNMDIFERFYDYNNGLYSDISNKVKVLRR